MPPTDGPTVVCGVDRAPVAVPAVRFAAAAADRLGAHLVLVHVAARPAPVALPPAGAAGVGQVSDASFAALEEGAVQEGRRLVRAAAAALDRPARIHVRLGARRDLPAAVARHRPVLTVLGARRGRAGEPRVGPVHRRMLHELPSPVAVVGPATDPSCRGPVAVLVDGTAAGRDALAAGARLAAATGDAVVGLLPGAGEPLEPATAARLRERASAAADVLVDAPGRITWIVCTASPGGVAEAAEAAGAAMLVVGRPPAHRIGRRRALQRLVGAATQPVLLVTGGEGRGADPRSGDGPPGRRHAPVGPDTGG